MRITFIITSNQQKSREEEEKRRRRRSAQLLEERKVVSFDCIQIREYSLCLGDNPAAKDGPPLSLDWKHGPTMTFKVDDYEEARLSSSSSCWSLPVLGQLQRPRPRVSSVEELLIPAYIRFQLIRMHTNTTNEEVKETINDMKRIQKERRTSFALQEFENTIIAFESIREKVKGLGKCFSNSSSSSTSKVFKNKQDKGSSSWCDCNCKTLGIRRRRRNAVSPAGDYEIKKSMDQDNHLQDRQLFHERPVHSPLGNARAA